MDNNQLKLYKNNLTIENNPDMVHTIKDILTLPVCKSTPVGETKIPEPMMLPTMTVIPFRRVIFGLRVISSSGFLASSMAEDPPRYP